MFEGLASAAKQALDNMRRAGPDPLVEQSAPKPKQAPERVTWLCGLDLGMMTDPTALAIIRKTVEKRDDGKRINRYAALHLQRWLGVDYPTIAEDLRPMLAALSPAPILIGDETGVGVGVLQILRRAKLPIASLKGIMITGGHQTTQRASGGYNVPKKELVAAGQSALQGKRLSISPKLKDARVLRKELSNFKVKITTSATETYEAWREGDHDDLVLAACMAIWFGDQGGSRLGAEHFGFIGYPPASRT